MWKYGITTRYRSAPPYTYAGFVHDSFCRMFAQMLRWVSIAPFGVPVVPPVYCSTATSAGSIVTFGSADGGTGRSRSASVSAPSMRGAVAHVAEYSARDVTTIRSIAV